MMNEPADGRVFDMLIAGGGTAGCVLAGRLSETANKSVLLIEAGADAPAENEHPDIRDPFPMSLANPSFCWPLQAEVGADRGAGHARAVRSFVQGTGVGGGSNIQGMLAVRGIPEDYDEWRDAGLPGWGWDDVLPYFKKLERDLDFAGPLHGEKGPIPIRRTMRNNWAPFSQALGIAMERRGYEFFPDYNADFREGMSCIPMANLPHQRVSASMAYLTKDVRKRKNLTIWPQAFVEKIDVQSQRARGAFVRNASGLRRVAAREVVVAGGALQSPAILMRSGVGPGDHLQRLGINVVQHLAGVGRNLQNHPKVQDVAVHLPRHATQDRRQRTLGQNCLRYSSGVENCGSKDMIVMTLNKTAWHPLGMRIGAVGVVVHKPYSKGMVELKSADPAVAPRIQFNTLGDPRDFIRLTAGLRFVLELLSDNRVSAMRHEAFLPQSRIVARLSRRSRSAWLQSKIISLAFEAAIIRRRLLGKSMLDTQALSQDESALKELVRDRVELSRHVCGTCKMGSTDDPYTVLDRDCRVRGVDGLRVIDASIFPTLMRANTHLPVLMVAEKMADQIKASWTI